MRTVEDPGQWISEKFQGKERFSESQLDVFGLNRIEDRMEAAVTVVSVWRT